MINLTKGASVTFKKVPTINVKVSWPAKTDYDLGAEILYKDGSTESIACFSCQGGNMQTVSKYGTVRHAGDQGRGEGMSSEELIIQWDDNIKAIAPWAYSAQSNGTGSFRKYGVSMTVTAGEETAHINADEASKVASIYTCVPGTIIFDDDAVSIVRREIYSDRGSERRPHWSYGQLDMNGPVNSYK